MSKTLNDLTTPPADPMVLFQRWFDHATSTLDRPNPNAFTLATVAKDGTPSARVVLAKAIHADGFLVFYTHYESRKGIELSDTGVAAGAMHWDSLGRQIRFEGPVVLSPVAESDAYFASRHWRSQLNAIVSEQSQPLTKPDLLEERAREIADTHTFDLADKTADVRLDRPTHWGGYRFWFRALEFWVSGTDRFHDRVRYERKLTDSGANIRQGSDWHHWRLQP